MQHRIITVVLTIALLESVPAVHAGDAGIEFFEKKIRPVLAEHCYECHSTTAKKVRGGLLVDSRDGLRKGGDSGPALEPGQPDKSLLIKAMRHSDPELKMPQQKKLPAAVIADFEAWVKMGAPDPRDKAIANRPNQSWEEILKKRRTWWSLQPVQNPAVPRSKNAGWSDQPIDRFLLAKLEEKGLAPASPADPRTLIRRLSVVLTGLPPTPEEVDRFVRDCGAATPGQPLPATAVTKLVDSLLASPHFGERWARHWMDVVRFSETHGNEWNYEVHHAWRYRDYLIRACNDDVPYDQIIREHLAGDLLKSPRWNRQENFNESVIGTAFYRFGEVNHDDCIGLRQIGYDLADNQIDTMTKAFQALTVACARCHDHKLDAVSMKDYYGLLGTVRSSRLVSHTIDAPEVNADILKKMQSHKQDIRRELAKAWLADMPRLALQLQGAAEKRVPKGGKENPDDSLLYKVLAGLGDDKLLLENPLTPWRLVMAGMEKHKAPFADAWHNIGKNLAKEDAERTAFNDTNFTTLADFRGQKWPDWQVGGQGLRGQPSPNGDFAVTGSGDLALSAILPAGAYTHVLSDKLNGTLRSPILNTGKKRISLLVQGQFSSAVRLVSNNCQLNYANFRGLHSTEPKWITFNIPESGENLRVYAELMTKFDNPKFPDPLGTLGGDNVNYRVPWEQAASNPRSSFGVTRVVLHDQPSHPKADLAHLRFLFKDKAPANLTDVAARYAQRLEAAIRAWMEDEATEDDVRWLDAFLQRGLLNNRTNATPKLAELVTEYRRLDGELSLPRIVPGVADAGAGIDQPIFIRGDCFRPGERTARRYAEVLAPAPFKSASSGRLELAELIASRDNPLTARVMVNRVWHHLFGAGLVRTVDDFGHVGDLPSHPELLDHLAQRFMADGWSMKRLIRAIVLTRAFQMSHQPSPAGLEADPNNRLLQHYPARRMEAEAIRDSLLAASGRLDRKLYGMSIPGYREKDNTDRRLFRGPLDGNGRRSIYIKVTLMEAPKFLEAFDLPGGKVAQGRRDVTNVPAQALAMLNDPFVLGQADVWGKNLLAVKNDAIEQRLDIMFQTALGRTPRAEERDRLVRFVLEVAQLHSVPRDAVLSNGPVWRDVAHTIFNLQEFITIP